QPRFDQLRLGKRSGDAHQRLVGKAHRAFRNGMDVAGEPEFSEIVDQVVAESSRAFEPIDFSSRKAQCLEVGEGILKPCREQESAAGWEPPHEKLKNGRLVLTAIQVGLDHIEFVEVSAERAGRWRHVDPGRTNCEPLFCPACEDWLNATLNLAYL